MDHARTRGLLALVVVIPAMAGCFHMDELGDDPRVGELGKVRFVGGGGCSSSTVMAVGSTAELELESANADPLPEDLAVGSSNPSVIEAQAGLAPRTVSLTAHDEGEAAVELNSAGAIYDRLGFSAMPAASVTWSAPARVLAGGTLVLDIEEVRGECHDDCLLIGGQFIKWQSAPTGAFTLIFDVDRKATFEAPDAAGAATIVGAEPYAGAVLVQHPVQVIDPAGAVALVATLTMMLPDESVLDLVEIPAEVPVGSLLLVLLSVEMPEGDPIPLTLLDATWTVEGDDGVLSTYGIEEGALTDGPVFRADAAGAVTLVADVPLVSSTGRFDVTVVD